MAHGLGCGSPERLTADASLPFDADAATAVDAAPDELNGWTPATAAGELQLALGVAAPEFVIADPVTAGHLFIGRSPATTTGAFGVPWHSGTLGTTLYGTSGNGEPAPISWEWRAIAGDGTVYLQMCCWTDDPPSSASQMRRLAYGTASGWSWSELPAPSGAIAGSHSSWPPRKFAISPGANPRVIVGNDDGQLWDVAGQPGTPSAWSRFDIGTTVEPDDLGSIQLLDRDRLLSVRGTLEVRICDLAGVSPICAPVAATGLPAGETPWELVVGGDRILLTTTSGHSYISDDEGHSFSAVELPRPGFLIMSPMDGRLALNTVATGSEGEALFISSDGASWTELPLPKSSAGAVQDLTFDAAGALYLLFGSRLFVR